MDTYPNFQDKWKLVLVVNYLNMIRVTNQGFQTSREVKQLPACAICPDNWW